MALPVPANTTCDIYRTGIAPPSAPTTVAVPCHLRCEWQRANEAGDRATNSSPWTHIMLVDVSVDLRDSYTGGSIHMAQDTVYIPDKNATKFKVIFIERLQRGTPHDHKRVYLDRQTPIWPTNEL